MAQGAPAPAIGIARDAARHPLDRSFCVSGNTDWQRTRTFYFSVPKRG